MLASVGGIAGDMVAVAAPSEFTAGGAALPSAGADPIKRMFPAIPGGTLAMLSREKTGAAAGLATAFPCGFAISSGPREPTPGKRGSEGAFSDKVVGASI